MGSLVDHPKDHTKRFFTIVKTNTKPNAKLAKFFIIFHIFQSAASKCKKEP
jgi:hypothetical protein